MSQQSKKQARVSFTLVISLSILGLIPVYPLGCSWLSYHRDNLVVFDCKIRSETIPLGSMYAGRIVEVFVTTGQRVEAGDRIAKLDTTALDMEAKTLRMRIQLAQEQAEFEALELENCLASMIAKRKWHMAKVQLAEIRTQASQAESRWIDEKQMQELQYSLSRERISRIESIVAKLDLETHNTSIEQVKARLAKISILKKEVDVLESELSAIEKTRSCYTIRSQFAGVVSNIFRGAGSSVRVGDSMLEIQGDKAWGEAWIDESEIAKVKMGAPVKITLKAYPDVDIGGRVGAFLSHPSFQNRHSQLASNPVLHLDSKVCVLVELESCDVQLVPGLTGSAKIKR